MWMRRYVMSLVSMSSRKSSCIDPLFAKVSMFLVGSELARNRGWKFVVLELDCEVLVNYWYDQQEISWIIVSILAQAHTLLPYFDNVVIYFIPRFCDYFAHNIVGWLCATDINTLTDISIVLSSICQDHCS
ncbi:hypothetical protein TorRG33x02_070430 [Trema orientale]|uniref:RNase H type-1 domain-containing protein n=1 Tax=Trema orientale TaxID=63057 RepID=A0A2P5FHN1_TREOI|nr:hypothetical protein TorRG33x02_070430 [Trema orientale]